MSRDYKPKSNKRSGSPFLTGLLIGFLLGVITSVALTMYIKGDTSPFKDKKINAPEIALPSSKHAGSEETEDDLDYYDILPETESTTTIKEINDAKVKDVAIKKSNYFLQVGSFKTQADADNLKAELALQGFEAVVQTADLGDKGKWHRVRVGPLYQTKEIEKVRDNLISNGFKADLIKIQSGT